MAAQSEFVLSQPVQPPGMEPVAPFPWRAGWADGLVHQVERIASQWCIELAHVNAYLVRPAGFDLNAHKVLVSFAFEQRDF